VRELSFFHFNCSVCGAHRRDVPFSIMTHRWARASRGRVNRLLAGYRDVLLNALHGKPGNRTKKFRRALEQVLRAFGADLAGPPPPVDGQDEHERVMLMSCPLCGSQEGPRPRDRHFTVWQDACRVQMANLLYEASILFRAVAEIEPYWATPPEIAGLCELLRLNRRALVAVSLMECPLCGRHTSCVYGDDSPGNPRRCRWCLDRMGGEVYTVLIERQGDGSFSTNAHRRLPEKLPSGIVPYFPDPDHI